MHLLVILALVAQIIDPRTAVQAYTTADPNNPDRLGLATANGRYSITLAQNCDGFGVGQNVLIYPAYQLPPWLTISTLDGQPDQGCIVRINGRMSDTPCFATDDGTCDVAIESDAQ